jgi:hypothetical protein
MTPDSASLIHTHMYIHVQARIFQRIISNFSTRIWIYCEIHVDFLSVYRNRLIYYSLVWSDTHSFHLDRKFNSVNAFQDLNQLTSFRSHSSNFCVDRFGRGSQGTKFADERRIVRQPRRECPTTRPPSHNTTHSTSSQRPSANIILCKVTYQRSEIWNSISHTILTSQRPLKSDWRSF